MSTHNDMKCLLHVADSMIDKCVAQASNAQHLLNGHVKNQAQASITNATDCRNQADIKAICFDLPKILLPRKFKYFGNKQKMRKTCEH
jgi:hypothetical protein